MPAARPLQRPNWPPYWLQVRSVSNSTAARLTILIPIVGYWIIFNEAVATKLIFDTNATVSWRLFATYFGLCFIAAASGIYQALCPREVKQYSSPTEYIAAVSPHMSDIEEKRVRVRLDAHAKAEVERGYRQVIPFPTIKNDDDARREAMRDRSNVLQAHFDQCNRSYSRWRGVVGACYLAGAFVMFWPTADIFLRVFGAMVRAIKVQWFG
jgi:hypothetical protein